MIDEIDGAIIDHLKTKSKFYGLPEKNTVRASSAPARRTSSRDCSEQVETTCAPRPLAIYKTPQSIPCTLMYESHLDPPQTRTAAAAIDKYPLARLEVRVVHETHPTRQTCQSHGPCGFKA